MNNQFVEADVLSFGAQRKTLKLDLSGCQTVRSVIEKNYHSLTGKSLDALESPWLDICTSQAKELCSWRVNLEGSWLNPADLIPRPMGSKLALIQSHGIRSDDRIEFYLENLMKNKGVSSFVELLHKHETQLLLWSKIESDWAWTAKPMLNLIFPERVMAAIEDPSLNYYNKFLVRYISSVQSLHRYWKLSREEGLASESARQWIKDFNYQMQIQLLTLLVIPEVFLRKFYPTDTYAESLQKLGFGNPRGGKSEVGENSISGRRLTEAFATVTAEFGFNSFDDYIVACQLDDVNQKAALSKILNLFRIYLNKTKHSSGVKIIRSSRAKEQREWRIQGLNRKIQKIGEDGSEASLRHKWDKEFEKNVSYSYEDYDFGDPEFLSKNGIFVSLDETSGRHFSVTFADLEVALKILAGVMTVLARATSQSAKQ